MYRYNAGEENPCNLPNFSRRSENQCAHLNSLAFAKRLQAGGAFTREQAEGLTEEIYAGLFNPSTERTGLKGLIAAGFTQQQTEPLIDYIKDYVTFFWRSKRLVEDL